MILPLLTAMILIAGPERSNHKGVQAWSRGDTARALEAFGSAAQADTTRGVYSFNSGTAKALSGKDGDADLTRAIEHAADPGEKARALYNRGTARLNKAASGPPGQSDPTSAITDLREALKIRPGWNEAARNLDRALRLRRPPQQDKKQKPDDSKKSDKNQDQDKKDNKDGKRTPDPKKDGEKQDPAKDGDKPPPDPKDASPANPGMDPRDAQRLLDGAAAREAQQAREKVRKNREESNDPDW